MKRIALIVLAILLLWSQWALATSTEKKVIAHRGASGYLPEHSLAAYAMAYAMGVDYLEPDLVLTKDGIPIALHDLQLDTMTNVAQVFPERARNDGRWYAIDFYLEEIKELRLNERVNAQTGNPVYPDRFPVAPSLFTIPTLEEIIQLTQGLNQSAGRDVGIYPELKFYEFHTAHGFNFPEILLDVLYSYGYRDKHANIYVQAFHPAPLEMMRFELKTELPLVQLIGGDTWWNKSYDFSYAQMQTPEGLDTIAQYADGIGPWIPYLLGHDGQKGYPVINPTLVADAKERGLQVHAYTVRKDQMPGYVESIEELLELLYFVEGAHGLFIDHPDYAIDYLKNRE